LPSGCSSYRCPLPSVACNQNRTGKRRPMLEAQHNNCHRLGSGTRGQEQEEMCTRWPTSLPLSCSVCSMYCGPQLSAHQQVAAGAQAPHCDRYQLPTLLQMHLHLNRWVRHAEAVLPITQAGKNDLKRAYRS
jgi:hypothetical protein